MLSRRRFLGAAGGVAGAAAAGAGTWAALLRNSVEQSGQSPTTTTSSTTTTAGAATTTTAATPATVPMADRVLVVVQMAGGNDGLNTLIPADGAYRDARPIIGIPEEELVVLSNTDFSLHPALAPLSRWWNLGSMTAVEGVESPTESVAFQIDGHLVVGCVGGDLTHRLARSVDGCHPGRRGRSAAGDFVGGGSPMLVGDKSLATVIQSAAAFQLRAPEGVDREGLISAFLATASPLSADPVFAAAQQSIPSTIDAVDLLSAVIDDAGSGGDQSATVGAFDVAARIINLGIGTQVITIGLNGYDTHSDQLARQSGLLDDLATGIAGFMERIESDGNSDRVTLMTMSEFGRRVGENGSGGTDHGQGGLQLLFGPSVNGWQIHGELDLVDLADGDVPTRVDERSVYADVLDWLGGPTDEILGSSFDRIGALAV